VEAKGGAAEKVPRSGEGAGAAAGHGDDAEMRDQQDAAGAAAAGDADAGVEADGKHQPGPGAQEHRSHYSDKLTVFIKGLKPRVKDAELAAFIKSHVSGGVKDIRVIRDTATGQARVRSA
jgi:hypothetical protein